MEMQEHADWLANRYEQYPPIRLAVLQDEEEEPIWVDQLFADVAHVRGVYAPPVKRGPGRPRKHPIKG